MVADVLTQLHGHSLYHRGQIASLVRAAGGEPAKTDFIFWSRESVPPPQVRKRYDHLLKNSEGRPTGFRDAIGG